MTIRYPNGQSITYNNACFLSYKNNGAWELYEDKDEKRWVASIQATAGVILEVKTPCKIENPIVDLTLRKAVEMVIEHIKCLSKYDVAKLKRKVKDFSTRTYEWKKL